jgi:hypothetical protein
MFKISCQVIIKYMIVPGCQNTEGFGHCVGTYINTNTLYGGGGIKICFNVRLLAGEQQVARVDL